MYLEMTIRITEKAGIKRFDEGHSYKYLDLIKPA